MRTSPSLIVPIRDRRSRRRILTLKNFGKVALGMIIFFAGLTIQSNYRHPENAGNYGRLLDKQVSSHVALEQKKADMVTAPIQDQTAADPVLVAPAARAQWLGVDAPATTATTVPVTDTNSVAGPNNVVIQRGKIDQQHPTLSGGIFRQ